MEQIKNIFNWFYERTALWIILFAGFIFMTQLAQINEFAAQTKKGNADCRIKCSPNAYEYISDNKDNKCWCYQDKETLNLYIGE